MPARKPRIEARPSDCSESRNERVIRFTFPSGKTGKVSFFENVNGAPSVMFYDCSPGVLIYATGDDRIIYTAEAPEAS